MAGKTIASGAAVLTAKADGLKRGLDTAERDLRGWGSRVKGMFSGGFGAGMLFGGGAAVAAAGVNALINGAQSLYHNFVDVAGQIDKVAKLSRNLGMSTEGLSGLQHAADLSGVSMGDLESSLLRFRKNVDGPLDDALMDFARRYETLGSEQAKAKALTEAFGKSGLKMGTLFENGAVGLQTAMDKAKALGKTFTAAEAAKMEAANDAITNAKAAFKGMFQKILIGLAPVVEKFADFAANVMQWVRPVFDWLMRATDTYAKLWMGTFEAAREVVAGVAEWVGKLGGEMFGFTGELPSIQEVFVGFFRIVGKAGAYTWDVIKFGAGAVALGIGTVIGYLEGLADKFKSVIKGIADAGAAIADALELPDTAARFRKLGAGADRIVSAFKDAGKSMADWGRGAMAGFGKSAEAFDSWLNKLLEPKAAAAVADKMGKIIEEAPTREPLKFSAAIAKGSKEAYSLVMANAFSDKTGRLDVMKDIAKHGKRAADAGKGAEKRLEKIEGALKEIDAF